MLSMGYLELEGNFCLNIVYHYLHISILCLYRLIEHWFTAGLLQYIDFTMEIDFTLLFKSLGLVRFLMFLKVYYFSQKY